MKIEECKAGTLVIAHKKSYMNSSMEGFMQLSPFGVGTIRTISHVPYGEKVVNIVISYQVFSFYPDDLSEVKWKLVIL